MVTMNSGSATPTSAVTSNTGAVNEASGSRSMPDVRPDGSSATTTIAATSAPGTAQRRATRRSTAQVMTIGAACAGASAAKRTGSRQTVSSTPASIALAIGPGIVAISRPSRDQRPGSASSAPVTTNAPTAAGQPPSSVPEDTSSAAPGVDQPIVIGIRPRSANTTVSSPLPTDSASRPELACAGV